MAQREDRKKEKEFEPFEECPPTPPYQLEAKNAHQTGIDKNEPCEVRTGGQPGEERCKGQEERVKVVGKVNNGFVCNQEIVVTY